MFVNQCSRGRSRSIRLAASGEHPSEENTETGGTFVKKLALLVAATATVALVVVAFAGAAETYTVSATLKNNTEVPKPKGRAPREGRLQRQVRREQDRRDADLEAHLLALVGNALAAHIHMGKPGVAGPVVVPLCGPCKNGQTGKVHISKAVISALEGGKAYINVHTKKNAAGEIRGQAKVAE
jgi:hypothetical protein